MNETIKTLINRRSIHKFKSDQIKDEQLNQILEAGMYAPNGRAAQSPIMIVVQDEETIRTLSEMNAKILGAEGKDPFYGAPTVVIVMADPERSTYLEDGSLVMGNLMNAAYSVGVDSCWIHRARQTFESEEGKALLKKWGVDTKYVGIGNCVLGYHDGPYPEAKARKKDYIVRV